MYSRKLFAALFVSISCLFAAVPAMAADGDSVTFSMSPPLFRVDMNKGQNWSSVVKVVNNNSYATTVYVEVLNFTSGEEGGVKFLRDKESDYSNHNLRTWISIGKEPLQIPPYGSREVPFTIKAPANADPGGHYAAIMIGNQPSQDTARGTNVKFSSRIASLILVKINGEVKEEGHIKEFDTASNLTGSLAADFDLVFANTGNVHIQPRGVIKISNIWGQVRGEIPVNQVAEYGNILPGSDKVWHLSWQGKSSVLDAGPMRAELSLSYGEDKKFSATRTIRFWTFDLKPTLAVLGVLFAFVLSIVLLVRYVIQRNIRGVREQIEALNQASKKAPAMAKPVEVKGLSKTVEPRGSKWSRQIEDNSISQIWGKVMNWIAFKKSLVAAAILVIVAIVAIAIVYGRQARRDEAVSGSVQQPAAIATANDPIAAATTSEQVTPAPVQPGMDASRAGVQMEFINGTGSLSGSDNAIKKLEEIGFKIMGINNSNLYDDVDLVVKYSPDQVGNAQAIDALFGNIGDLRPDPQTQNRLTVITGKKFPY